MSHFERAWVREPNLRLVGPGLAASAASTTVGESADRLTEWVAKRLGELAGGDYPPTLVDLNRFKVRLVDRLLAEYLATPEPQRSIVRDSEGDPGLIGVFLTALEVVADLALTAEPPPLWEPPKPSRAKKVKPPQPAGTWFMTEDE